MLMQFDDVLIESLQALMIDAGAAVVKHYDHDEPSAVTYKKDQSPLTEADLDAHKVLYRGLQKLAPNIPILSEEGQLPDYAERREWRRYWLMDPLDGTKEFINRTGDFTVNLALIEEGKPILGFVYAPLAKCLYLGVAGDGAYRVINGKKDRIKVESRLQRGLPLRLLVSRRHGHNERLKRLLSTIQSQHPIESEISFGSSLKLCKVAEGLGDFYPRLAPTSEWDTAAAQAVVEAAGGYVVDTNWQRLRYNQKNSVLNPEFYVLGDEIALWRSIVEA